LNVWLVCLKHHVSYAFAPVFDFATEHTCAASPVYLSFML